MHSCHIVECTASIFKFFAFVFDSVCFPINFIPPIKEEHEERVQSFGGGGVGWGLAIYHVMTHGE